MLRLTFAFEAIDENRFRISVNGTPTGAELLPAEQTQEAGKTLREYGLRLYNLLFPSIEEIKEKADVPTRAALAALAARRANAAGDEPPPVEIALLWAAEQENVHALVWEWLHDGENFLAAYPDVAVTRRVPCPQTTFADGLNIAGRPHVLFVVGSALSDPNIRPGAEILSMLRCLRAAGGTSSVVMRVLLDASPRRLEETVAAFRPNGVHFICHGTAPFGGNPAKIQIRNDDDPKKTEELTARQILEIFQKAKHLPAVVIMNACNTGTMTQGAEAGIGMAGELIAGGPNLPGVGLAVGMVGRMQDDSCRLFTRNLYDYLFSSGNPGDTSKNGKNILLAVAYGRRFGMSERATGTGKEIPVLLLSDSLDDTVVHASVPQWQTRLPDIANQFAPTAAYPAFCGRYDVMELYDALMQERGITDGGGPFFCLGLEIPYPGGVASFKDGNGQEIICPKGSGVGGSRLLAEMARKAVIDGHIPILLDTKGARSVATAQQLLEELQKAIQQTAGAFGLGFWLAETHPWFILLHETLRDLTNNIKYDGETLFVKDGALILPYALKAPYAQVSNNILEPVFLTAAILYVLLSLRETVLDERCKSDERCKEEIAAIEAEDVAPPPALPKETRISQVKQRMSETRLLILVADVHKMGDAAAATLLDAIQSTTGIANPAGMAYGVGILEKGMIKPPASRLPPASQMVRMALLYADNFPQQQETLRQLQNNDFRARIRTHKLRVLGETADECRTDYTTFLMFWQNPRNKPNPQVVNDSASQELIDGFFLALHDQVGGLPNLLDPVGTPIVQAIIRYQPCLRRATDDDWLREWGGKGGIK